MADRVETYVITPTWESAAEMAGLARSLVECTNQPVSWIVVENGSGCREKEGIKEVLARVRSNSENVQVAAFIENQTNLGIPVAQNQGLDWIERHDTGPYPYHVVLLSVDTYVEPNWLERLLLFIENRPDIGIVGGAKSKNGIALPVYHDHHGNWYQHTAMQNPAMYQGESVDFSGVLLRWELLEAGLRFDCSYEIYDGYDQDLCFRVRSWGYRIFSIDAGIVHLGSAIMKRRGYQWAGGGCDEWHRLRKRNIERFRQTWEPFLVPRRLSIQAEVKHVAAMNHKLMIEAGDRKDIPCVVR